MDESTEDPRMWYVRLRIRDDRLAKLWAWKLAEHDVIVWSEAEERWKQLLAVPELRAAVRKATTSAYVRKSAPPPALPAAQLDGPDSRTRRRHLSVAEFEGDELTTRVNRDSSFPDMEPTAVNQAPRSIRHASSIPPPPPLDMLRALSSTSIPPALHSSPPPQFPPAPRVPSISELARSSGARAGAQEPSSASFLRPPTQSEYPPAHSLNGVVTRSGYSPAPSPGYPPVQSSYPPAQSSYPPPPPSALQRRGPTQVQVMHPAVRPQYVVAKPASQFTIKNLSWAMLPVACAGVFAIFLDRYAPPPVAQSAPTVITVDMEEPGSGQLRPWLGSLLGMSLGSAQTTQAAQPAQPAETAPASQPSPNLTPEQLAPVGAPSKASAATSRGAAAYAAARASTKASAALAKAEEKDKAGAAAGNGGSAAAAAQPALNETFDREGARTALKFAAARVRNCSNSGVTGSALITFGPSGTVQKVQVTQMVGDDVDASCVNRALAGTRVPPFTGAPVTVRKSF